MEQVHRSHSSHSPQRKQSPSKKTFEITGTDITPQNLTKIIETKQPIKLSDSAREKVIKSRTAVQDMMSDPKKVVYGINTGFGNFADKIISKEERSQLQDNLIRSHSVGVGKPISKEIVKRMIILRINTLSKGRSGISIENLEKFIKAYNCDYIPRIPEQGTVGASGDLAPLSHLALGMMGQGLVWNQQQHDWTDAKQIMVKKNLTPIQLTEKQGLALINGTQFMTSIISEVAASCKKLLNSAIIIYAFAIQLFGLDHFYFSEENIKIATNGNERLAQIFRRIKSYLDSNPSELHKFRSEEQSKLCQNKWSDSLLHQIEAFEAFLESIDYCTRLITEEMNSATDNPLVFLKQDGFDTDVLISAGNFHGEYVAKASDFIGMSLFGLGRFSESRVQRYINDRISNLPGFLILNGGLNNGFMIAQYTTASLLSQSKVLVKPASVDSISTSASQEDHVSMGGFAARKAKILLDNMAHILGIELMCALQSIDIINKTPSSKLNGIKQKVRELIPTMAKDKYFAPEIEKSKELVLADLETLLEPKN